MLLRRTFRVATRARLAARCVASHVTYCVLCDEDTSNFAKHCNADNHVARFAICNALVAPEKHRAMLTQLWEHLRLDFDAVDTVNGEKIAKRRGRLSSTLQYLAERQLLWKALPQQQQEGPVVVHRAQSSMIALGESHARRVTTDRVARLFPACTGYELRCIVNFILSPWHLHAHYDILGLGRLTNAQQIPSIHKASFFCACVGELHGHVNGTKRPTSVANRKAADDLVMNVLATHALENVLADLLHHVLQRTVEQCTPVWTEFKQSLAAYSMRPRRPPPAPLAIERTPAPAAAIQPEDAAYVDTLDDFWFASEGSPRPACAAAPPGPKVQWTDVARSGALDLAPVDNATKAVFVTATPKLAAKPAAPNKAR